MTQIDPQDPTLYSLSGAELARLSRGVALGLLKSPKSIEHRSQETILVRFQSCGEAERARACIA